MKIVATSYVVEDPDHGTNGMDLLRRIERSGRTCYKSEEQNSRIGYMAGGWDPEKTKKFVKMLIERSHESVLEHEKLTVRIIFDRGCSHELVRHRIASFSQESTRYCNYSKDKFGNEVTFIDLRHLLKNPKSADVWLRALKQSEENYLEMLDLGESPQIARSVLVNSLKTELVITGNIREWRLIFKQRTSSAAHPQMREIMIPLLKELQQRIPIVFDDIKENA